MARDLHKNPFDESTKVKLSLFEGYLREWLPVFLAAKDPKFKTINVFDFFAGPGKSDAGDEGTPMLIFRELRPYVDGVAPKGITLNVYLNEYDDSKFASLKQHVPTDSRYKTHFENLEFGEAFKKYLPEMKGAANLLLLDQSGIKQITESVLKSIIELPGTDFIFFISSSTIQRFNDHPSIAKYVSIPKSSLTAGSFDEVHRKLTDYYRSLIPSGRSYYLVPFSLKKGVNVYGLIFGSGHPLGREKFLRRCWKEDPERGEANFDIDDDRLNPRQPALFADMNKPKKRVAFEKRLEEAITKGLLKDEPSIREFTLDNGFLPSHSKEIVRKMKKAGILAKRKRVAKKAAT